MLYAGTVTSDWRPSTPALDADSVRGVVRDHPVVAIHFWATWNGHDRTFDEELRPLRDEFRDRVVFGCLDWDNVAGAELAGDSGVTNLPALAIWIRGRWWRTFVGLGRTGELGAALREALRLARPETETIGSFVREPDRARIVAWGSEMLGPLEEVEAGPVYFVHRSRSGAELRVEPPRGDDDFASIWIGAPDGRRPFASNEEFARAAYRRLAVEARAALGDASAPDAPRRMRSFSGNGERTIEILTLWSGGCLDDRLYGLAVRRSSGLGWQIARRYGEPHRAYHTMLHLNEAHDALWEFRHLLARPAEVEVALWFHDVVYDTHRHDNEERSADWARQELLRAGAPSDVATRVHALVLATKHRDVPEGNDARLLVDADLSILAAPPDRFLAYERQIRQEYDWVPEPEFREAREKFLRGMLGRPSIFNDSAMRERHEAHARRNIEESLRRLASGTS